MSETLGFDGLLLTNEAEKDQKIRSNGNFEEVHELEALQQQEEDDKDTVYFERDGKLRKIDFVLTFEDEVEEKKKWSVEEHTQRKQKRKDKRERFFRNLKRKGVWTEIVEPENSQTHFVKVHSTFAALEKGAEELLVRMPIKEVDLSRKDIPWYRDLFRKMKVRDPFEVFEPKIPQKFEHRDFFTAPYMHNNKEEFEGSDDEDTFFSSAQRSAITMFILEHTQYADEEDQIGISRLIQNGSLSAAYPLHDGSYRVDEDKGIENERQLLYREWSHPRNWYKYQPLDNIRHYFGEKIGLYFVWVGYYTYWLLWASIVGIIITICGLYTLARQFNPVAREICDEDYREFFYMCPLCDETCDFWYYRTSCAFAHVTLLFDYGGTVFFAGFMALWAVVFMEFWKRTEAQLQYEWDTLGYEAAEERERPEFVREIKKRIRNLSPGKENNYIIYNRVLDRYEHLQPAHYLWPKISAAFSILSTMVAAVLGIVFAVLIYRLAVSSAIYRVIRKFPGGPSAADLLTSVTGSIFQLIAIIVMNQIYERVAYKLTKWELHRTKTEFEDSFTFKMYIFQFVNFYSSLFYIAFFKGNFVGYPGEYIRIGSYRLAECPTYGCLLELTIQLGIIFIGKQVLNDIVELGKPYGMKLFKVVTRRRKEKQKETTRWGKDLVLAAPSIHDLFFEYIELVIQYGFVTIFVSAFPLAPFFALLNNVIEIRLDAHKFVQVLRRPVAERAQDIGAWFYLLKFTTNLCVITNAFLIAFTSDFINLEVYNRFYSDKSLGSCYLNDDSGCSDGVVAWSTSAFSLSSLLEPIKGTDNETTFPFLSVMGPRLYEDGNIVERVARNGSDLGKKQPILYLPFLNFSCLRDNLDDDFDYENFTESEFNEYNTKAEFQNLTLETVGRKSDGRVKAGSGMCFISDTKCRFRGQIEEDGELPLKYWRTMAAKLSFVIIFEHVIFLIGIVLDLLIPDIPKSVKDEIRREKYLASKISAKDGRVDQEERPASKS